MSRNGATCSSGADDGFYVQQPPRPHRGSTGRVDHASACGAAGSPRTKHVNCNLQAAPFVSEGMRFALVLALLAVQPITGATAPKSPDELMRAMAERFEQASITRRSYVYRQVVKSSLVKRNGELVERQHREYTATPTAERTEKTLTAFEGVYVRKGKHVAYTDPKAPDLPEGIDHELLDDLTGDLVDDKQSRDGLPRNLFPLSLDELQYYTFRGVGSGELSGRALHKVSFEPKGKEVCINVGGDDKNGCDSRPWKGEVWIDAEDLQPVRIATELNRKVPVAVRLLLGTNLGQLGFSVTYKRVAPGVWFPATYGTEFNVSVLFAYKRTITLSMESGDFRVADVRSKIEYAGPH